MSIIMQYDGVMMEAELGLNLCNGVQPTFAVAYCYVQVTRSMVDVTL